MQPHFDNILDNIISTLLIGIWGYFLYWSKKYIGGWWQREREADQAAGKTTAFDTQGLLILGLGILIYVILCVLCTLGLCITAYIFIVPHASFWALLPVPAIGFGIWGCQRGMNVITIAQAELREARKRREQETN